MLWLINTMRGYDLTSEPQTLKALRNAFILIYHCDIYLYIYILFPYKSKYSRGCCFYRIILVNTMCLFFKFFVEGKMSGVNPIILLPSANSVKKLNLNWVFKTQCIIRNFFLYCNLFDPEKTQTHTHTYTHTATKVKSNPNRLCNL